MEMPHHLTFVKNWSLQTLVAKQLIVLRILCKRYMQSELSSLAETPSYE